MPVKVRADMRMDADVHEGIKQLAEEAGMNFSQLVNGLCRWAVHNGHAGRPDSIEHDGVMVVDDPEVIWFGRPEPEDVTDRHGNFVHQRPPEVLFELDLSPNAAVRGTF